MTNDIALVTGAAGALGVAICSALDRDGLRVVGTDVRSGTAAGRWPLRHCDLMDACDIRIMFEEVVRDFGQVSVLVNNAALYRPSMFVDLEHDQWEQTFAVNVTAPMLTSQIFARHRIATGRDGAIVNVASVAGQGGSASVDYASSKAALIGMTKSLGRVLAPHNIRVNAVAPGGIESAMSRAMLPVARQSLLLATPMARLAEPSEIADVIAFLAGKGSSYITGTTVDVNGGYR